MTSEESGVITTAFPLRFERGRTAVGVRIAQRYDVPAALAALGLPPAGPVLVVVGGAGGLDDRDAERLRAIVADGVVSAAVRCGAAMMDGGTLSGVMRLLGDAHYAASASTPLIGIAAVGTITLPGDLPGDDDAAPLEPHHTHFILVPGDEWGAEAAWIADIATAMAGRMPSATVLINGGDIAYDDVERSITAGRQVLTVAGSGRTADQLAAALGGDTADPRANALAASGLIRAVPIDEPALVGRTLAKLLEQP